MSDKISTTAAAELRTTKAELAALKKKNAALERQLADAAISAAASDAMLAAGIGAQAALIRPHLLDRMKIDPASLGTDRKARVMVVDAYGSTSYARPADLLEELRRGELAPLFGKADGGRK